MCIGGGTLFKCIPWLKLPNTLPYTFPTFYLYTDVQQFGTKIIRPPVLGGWRHPLFTAWWRVESKSKHLSYASNWDMQHNKWRLSLDRRRFPPHTIAGLGMTLLQRFWDTEYSLKNRTKCQKTLVSELNQHAYFSWLIYYTWGQSLKYIFHAFTRVHRKNV